MNFLFCSCSSLDSSLLAAWPTTSATVQEGRHIKKKKQNTKIKHKTNQNKTTNISRKANERETLNLPFLISFCVYHNTTHLSIEMLCGENSIRLCMRISYEYFFVYILLLICTCLYHPLSHYVNRTNTIYIPFSSLYLRIFCAFFHKYWICIYLFVIYDIEI